MREGRQRDAAEALRPLVREIVERLVDEPSGVEISCRWGGVVDVEVTIRTARGDVGKVVGKQGRTARALRSIVNAMGRQAGMVFTLNIEQDGAGAGEGN